MNKAQLDKIRKVMTEFESEYAECQARGDYRDEDPEVIEYWNKLWANGFEALVELEAEHADRTYAAVWFSPADVEHVFGEKFANSLTDSDMEYLAGKIGDDLMDAYWESLREVIAARYDTEEKEEDNEMD